MRVRYKRPPILLVFIMALVCGAIYYMVQIAPTDNSDNLIEPLNEPVAEADFATITEKPMITPTPTLTSRIVREAPTPELLEIPADTTILIPSLGLFANIVEVYLDGVSWDVSQLEMNVGHLQGTPWLGENGNVVLSGHVEMRDGRSGIFSRLNEVTVGERIEINSEGETRIYQVTDVRVTTPDDLEPILPTTTDQLTLITCGGYDFFQNAYLDRIIVVAQPVS